MRRFIYSCSILLLSIWGMAASCTTDQSDPTTPNIEEQESSVTLKASTSSATRVGMTEISSGNSSYIALSWQKGVSVDGVLHTDAFSLYKSSGDYVGEFTYIGSSGATSGSFQATEIDPLVDGESYTAMFPAIEGDAERNLEQRKELALEISTQTKDSSMSHLNTTVRMSGEFVYSAEQNNSFEFVHDLAIAVMTYSLESGRSPVKIAFRDNDKSYELLFDNLEPTFSSSYKSYMLIEPSSGENRTITIVVTDSQGESITFEKETSTEYMAGYYYTAEIEESETEDEDKNENVEESLNLVSEYVDTYDPNGLTINAVDDYGVYSHDSDDQTSKLQSAINDLNAQGGGNLIIPAGTYCMQSVYMRSNVHILVDENAVLKPVWSELTTSNIIMIYFDYDNDKTNTLIENCSIRARNGGTYKVDYSHLTAIEQSVRFIVTRDVRNFLIADAEIFDNYTKHCGVVFSPTTIEGGDTWEVSRPTNGEIRDLTIHNSCTGYGLCQLHGAQSLYFENLTTNIGGVTLRLESGAGGDYAGVFDIRAKNITAYGGRCAVLFNPHTTANGTVRIDGVTSYGSSVGVIIQDGFIDEPSADDPDATPGVYANDCEIINLYIEYGQEALNDRKDIWMMEPDDAKYALFTHNPYGNSDVYKGPSLATAMDCSLGSYTVTFRNFTSSGFATEGVYGPVYQEDVADREADKWNILSAIPNYNTNP